jgi:tetratricopeptide (TPR) repeat protein
LDRSETEIKVDDLDVRQDDVPPSPPQSLDLLSQGEALFATGRYHEAIHVWTRILFVDRSNSEARIRIDRAKDAVAERLRTLDARVEEARALLDGGNVEGARERVRSVLAADGRHGDARQLADAIDALQRKMEPPVSPPEPATLSPRQTASSKGVILRVPKKARGEVRGGGTGLRMAGFLFAASALFGASALYLSRNWDAIVGDGAFGRSRDPAAAFAGRPGATVPDLSELHFFNGERLFAQGRYREALSELRRVDRDSKVAPDARSLVLRIEERLLRDPADEASKEEVSR